MKPIFLFLFVLFYGIANAQLLDDFSDGDFKINPVWVGDTNSWKIVSGALKSDNQISSSQSYLSTISNSIRNTESTMLINLQFNTSGANYVDIYLAADSVNLKSSVRNGYFVRIGGTKDEISLYKRSNGLASLLIDGIDGSTNKSSNTIALRVTCNGNFQWNIERNLAGLPNNYTSEGTIADSTIKVSNWFGILVVQSTASFFQKHTFDDISVRGKINDTLPANLIAPGLVKNMNPLRITFDEEVDSNWVNSKGSLQLFDSAGMEWQIRKVEKDASSNLSYNLFWVNEITKEGVYTLKVNKAKDLFGNTAVESSTFKIVFSKPIIATYKQIVLTELMPDPVPSAGLPEKEYVEIYNNTDKTFDLKDYVFSDPSTSVKLPSYLFLPNQYLILCRAADTADFKPFGNVLPLSTMPSLNNSSDVITLTNAAGTLIDRVSYALSWYKDSQKDDGGYSLELIDPTNYCLIAENWQASQSAIGGTPGSKNSVLGSLKDEIVPSVVSLNVISPTLFQVFFSEKIDSASLVESNFSLDFATIKSTVWKADSLDRILVNLKEPLPSGKDLVFSMNSLKDCSGNVNSNVHFSFAIPEASTIGDILINELLFNPLPYGADFVEIYNNSEKYIDLKGWMLANLKNDTIANRKVLFKNSFILKPKEYLVFTEDKNNIQNTYIRSHADRIVEVALLPTYYDDLGNVILMASNGTVMDRLEYDQSMHSPLVSKKEGVSIEKINPNLATNVPSNWTSAAKENGNATPGYANSQYIGLGISEDDISIEPILITPNGDGDKDFMVLTIRSDKIGSLRNIIIFDIMGRETKRLLKSGFAGTQTLVQWDGTDESNNPLPVGHYIIWLEAIDKSGSVLHYKKKVVVGARF